jgi:hypothetical protein
VARFWQDDEGFGSLGERFKSFTSPKSTEKVQKPSKLQIKPERF